MHNKDLIKSSLADELENHLEQTILPQTKTEQHGNTKIITEYRWNKYWIKEKVVRIHKIEKRLVSKTIAERKTWAKFGDSCNDKPGPNTSTTILAEEIHMQFLSGKDDEVNENPLDELENVNMYMKCRNCGGEHLSFSCHLKRRFLSGKDGDKVKENPLNKLKNVYMYMKCCNCGGEHWSSSCHRKEKEFKVKNKKNKKIFRKKVPKMEKNTSTNRSCVPSSAREGASIFDRVTRKFLVTKKKTGAYKGYAFVNFKSKMDAERAIKGLHGYDISSNIKGRLIFDLLPLKCRGINII